VSKEGIFGGPGKADAYAKQAGRPGFVENNPADFAPIPPPEDIGTSIATLLGKGVIFSQQSRKKLYDKSDVVRGWSLADFWENTRWPRDSSGSSDVRYGLAVTGVDEVDEGEDDHEAPSRSFEPIAGKNYYRMTTTTTTTTTTATMPKHLNQNKKIHTSIRLTV
jgi:hypothetical protein